MATTIPSNGGNLILGSNLNDTINATSSNDTIYGYAGDDSINAVSGNDYIDGGLGNDTINGGADFNSNTLLGGAGNDSLYSNGGGVGNVDYFYGGAGNDTLLSDADYRGILSGGSDNDYLQTTDGSLGNSLDGGTGNDTLIGYTAVDTLTGGTGSDSITGDTGDDIIRYTNINDGGTFLFDFSSTTNFNNAVAAGGFDIITDFTGLGAAGGDIFNFASSFVPLVNDFAGSVFPTVQTGAIANSNFLPGSDRLFAYDTGTDTYLLYDQNTFSNNNTDTRILAKLVGVTGVATLNTSDFSFG